MQSKVITQADRVIGVSNGLTESLKSCGNCRLHKFVTITNGYDFDDFNQAPELEGKSNKFVICHCGAVTATNDPEPFLLGLIQALMIRPQLDEILKIEFVGYILHEQLREKIINLGCGITNLTGYKPHDQAIAHIKSADALLLIISDKVSTKFIPGKLFEYLYTKKPILAIVPPGETASILKESGLAYMVWPPQPDTIGKAILKMTDDYQKSSSGQVDNHFIESFERRRLTERLVRLLEDVVRI